MSWQTGPKYDIIEVRIIFFFFFFLALRCSFYDTPGCVDAAPTHEHMFAPARLRGEYFWGYGSGSLKFSWYQKFPTHKISQFHNSLSAAPYAAPWALWRGGWLRQRTKKEPGRLWLDQKKRRLFSLLFFFFWLIKFSDTSIS